MSIDLGSSYWHSCIRGIALAKRHTFLITVGLQRGIVIPRGLAEQAHAVVDRIHGHAVNAEYDHCLAQDVVCHLARCGLPEVKSIVDAISCTRTTPNRIDVLQRLWNAAEIGNTAHLMRKYFNQAIRMRSKRQRAQDVRLIPERLHVRPLHAVTKR